MALTNGDLQKIGSVIDNKLNKGFKEFGKEVDKKFVKQRVEIRNEWYDLFAEAFQGMISPMFKALGKDIKGIKRDIQTLQASVDTIDRRMDKIDDKLWEHQESIKELEDIHPAGKHAII